MEDISKQIREEAAPNKNMDMNHDNTHPRSLSYTEDIEMGYPKEGATQLHIFNYR